MKIQQRDNNGENKNLQKEDAKQPGQKIDAEKKAEVLKQEKNQDNEDNSNTQVKQAVPAQAPTVKSTPSPVSKEHSDAGRNRDGKGDNEN